MSEPVRLNADEIDIGKELPWAVYDAGGLLLLIKGTVIQSEKQLDILLARGL